MPKINLPENIKKLKSQLETGHNLVDYFLVAGINPSTCEDTFLFDFKNKDYQTKFKEKYKPTIISRFPSFDNAIDTIDEEIVNFCFPEGFEPIMQDANYLETKFYSVILDNNLFSAEHPQKYMTVLLFYEKLSDYKKLKYCIEGRSYENDPDCNDKAETQKPLQSEVTDGSNSYVKETIYSSTPNQNNMIINIQNNDNQKDEPINSTVLVSKKHSFVNTEVSSMRNVFIPKCICLVSIYPFVKLYQRILGMIYECIFDDNEIPLEKIIASLIIEVPVPPRGLYSIVYNLNGYNFILENNENNKIQLAEISMKRFNKMMHFKDKLEAFKHILLGSKILIFSRDLNKICECEIAFLHLLFPFKYPFQVTSLLHKDNYSILESISPFIIGINEPYSREFFEDNEITAEGMTIFIIDLDKKKTELITDEEFPNFPLKMVATLEKAVKAVDQKFKGTSHNYTNTINISHSPSVNLTYKQKNSFNVNMNNNLNNTINQINNNVINYSSVKDFNRQFQNLFLLFFSELLRGYEDCLNMDYFKQTDSDKVTSIDTLFKCDKFIKSHGSDIDFYSRFVNDSQLFADFIYKRMIPRNTQEIIDVLLINETIRKSKSKNKLMGKGHSDFLESTEYKAKNKYVVPKPKELTNEEIQVLTNRKHKLKYQGQILTSNSEGKNLFKYILFPELNFDIYCNNKNVNDYFPPPDYSEEMEALNIELISHSSLGQSINNALEMKNYLYLTWLEIWAFSFWYIDKEERPYRFNQMLDIIDKIIHHEMNIFNLMFDVLNQQKEYEMILNLYLKLLQKKLNPSTYIYNIISNIMDKDQIKQLFELTKQDGVGNTLKLDIETINLNERTLLNNYDKSLISSKLKFENIYNCIKCQKPINLFVLCQNFDNIKNDILWVPCSCGEYNIPKLEVKFGLEIFPSKADVLKKCSTRIKNEIVLYSPYNLKININNAVMTHYGGKLNIHNFKTKFSVLFWNFIWYCYLHHLDYSIILPYFKNLEKSKEQSFNNPNNQIMKITFDNELYKKNVVKLNEPSNNKTGKENIKKMMNQVNFVECKAISIEITKFTRDRNKKMVSLFIDYLNINQAKDISNLMRKKTLRDPYRFGDKKAPVNRITHAEINESIRKLMKIKIEKKMSKIN